MNNPINAVDAVIAWLSVHATSGLIALVILVAGWQFAKLASRLVERALPRAPGIDRNFQPLLVQVTRYGIIVYALVTALSFIGVSSTSIYAVIGAAGLAIALALQNTLANIAAGIMLIWQRPIAIGEYVVGNGVAGVVVEIGLFGTRLRSTSGLYIFVPNQTLWSGAITNHSREPRRRVDVNITIPDSADVGKSRAAMLAIAVADRRVVSDPAPTVHVESFVGDKIVLQLRAWVATPDYLPALRDVTEKGKTAINQILAAEGAHAEVALAADPHTQAPGERTPDLSAS